MRRIVATMTLARDEQEGRRILESLRALTTHGLPILVADGGSDAAFRTELERIDGIECVRPGGRGLVAQIVASLTAARERGADRVVYTEPDKLEYFVRGLETLLAAATESDDTMLAIAARSPAGFATFPPMQRAAERALNGIVAELTGAPGDYCYGPFDLPVSMLQWIGTMDASLGWGWRIALFLRAFAGGSTIRIVEGDHVCPDEQRTETASERFYRVRQLSQNIQGILHEMEAGRGIPGILTA